jgi:hypothetical protein
VYASLKIVVKIKKSQIGVLTMDLSISQLFITLLCILAIVVLVLNKGSIMSSFVSHLKRQKKQTLVILDLNGILVLRLHKNKVPEDMPKYFRDLATEVKGNFLIWRRPHLDEFLTFLFEHFDVGVWTSAMSYNADQILNVVFSNLPHLRKQLVFEWGQEHCKTIDVPSMRVSTSSLSLESCQNAGVNQIDTSKREKSDDKKKATWHDKVFLKMLSKVCEEFPEYGERNILFIDDSPEKLIENPSYTSFSPESFNAETMSCDKGLREDQVIRKILEDLSSRPSTTTVPDFFRNFQNSKK